MKLLSGIIAVKMMDSIMNIWRCLSVDEAPNMKILEIAGYKNNKRHKAVGFYVPLNPVTYAKDCNVSWNILGTRRVFYSEGNSTEIVKHGWYVLDKYNSITRCTFNVDGWRDLK